MKKKSVQKKRPLSRKIPPKKARFSLRASLKFLPALVLFATAAFVSMPPPSAFSHNKSVLGYATSTSISGLLSGTNSQRSANGVASLNLSSTLNSAAQTKANDMVTRDYWSHNTPDGQEPWVFFSQAGYNYKAAGENLAYGFATSGDTITGWMNSPPHRENLLKSAFLDVGFGIANSPNYVGNGEQTVVVAMYGTLASATAAAAAPAVPAAPAPSQPVAAKTVHKTAPTPSPAPTAAEPIETTPEPAAQQPVAEEPQLAASQEDKTTPVAATATPVKVRRIQLLTSGNATWSATFMSMSIGGIGVLWLIHHGLRFKRFLLSGEHYLVHHLHFDITFLAVLTLGWTLLSGSGVIR